MSFSNKWYGMGLAIILTLLFGVGIAQSATIKCGGGVFFFREYTDDGINDEVHFTSFQFTNTSSTATRTISKIDFFDTQGALFFTVGPGGDKEFVDVGFDPVLGPNEQGDLNMTDVFDSSLSGVQRPARLVATANGSLVANRTRIVRGFIPGNPSGKKQQEERSRVTTSCTTVG